MYNQFVKVRLRSKSSSAQGNADDEDALNGQRQCHDSSGPSATQDSAHDLPLRNGPPLKSAATFRSSTTVRKGSRVSTNSGSDPLGLQIVHDTEDALGDLVFVHGLGGTAWKTWSWSSDETSFWPHWLPECDDTLADFRISSFGYNAKFKGSATNLDIIDFAKDLLFQLMTVLTVPTDARARPLIFVAHSMGGLVVKKAFALGKHDKQYAGLVSRVSGMLFLATPHRGSQYAKILNNILSAAPLATSAKAYVAGLGAQSSAIQDINESFRQQCDGIRLCSLYETLKTSAGFTKILVVEKESAMLGYPNELSAAMDADHHSICRYQSKSDANFLKVLGVLKQWTGHLSIDEFQGEEVLITQPGPVTNMNVQISQLLGVNVTTDDSFANVPRGSHGNGSGKWLFDKPDFQHWTSVNEKSSSKQFLLIGLPGAGKTVLSRATITYLASHGHTVQKFFFDQAHRQNRGVSYCIRNLAAQIAANDEVYRDALIELYGDTDIFTTTNTTFQSLWDRLFESLLFQLPLKKPLYWVLDGIDESDGALLLLSYITKMKAAVPIRVFISSRPLKTMETPNMTMYLLKPTDTGSDMETYVSDTVQEVLPGDTKLQTFVREEILRKADGSFLWAKLALEVMQDSWHTEEDIRLALTEVPEGMTAMYARMAQKIDDQTPRNRQLAKDVISWVAFSWRPLSLRELGEALKPDFGVFTNLALSVTQICGHFVTLEQSVLEEVTVSLIHLTAKDFLINHRDGKDLWIDPRQSHERITKVLLTYLCNDLWKKHYSTSEVTKGLYGKRIDNPSPVNRLASASREYPLLTYATLHWAYHLSKGPIDVPEIMEILETFMLTYCLVWIEGIALSGNMSHLIQSAQYLRTFIKRSNRKKHGEAQWLQLWATDFIRIAGKFAGNLVVSPASVHRNIPAMCPNKSMIAKTFGTPRPGSLSVAGLPSTGWDDCLASITTCDDEYATRILVNETHFFILADGGKVSICRASTCEHVKVLRHEEYVSLMTVSQNGTLLATSGYDHYFVWDSVTGDLLYRVPRLPLVGRAMARDLSFGREDNELIVALDNCTVECVDLITGSVSRTLRASLSGFEAKYQGCPWRQSISPDGTKIAMAWRGIAPLVWDLRTGPGVPPVKCRTVGAAQSLLYSQNFAWRPDADALMILCNNTALFEWRLFEDEVVEFPHIKARDMAISPDGSLLLTADSQGVINAWSFPYLNLIYSLTNSGDSITDMAFSINNQRFYDIRNSTCNIWEPDALVRAEDQDFDEASSTAGYTAITEPVLSAPSSEYATIRAMAAGPADASFACGREDGTVIIHSAVDGQRERKVYTHPSPCAVIMLAWSNSGKYMVSCDDAALLVVKRLQRKDDGKWAVFPCFELRLDSAIRQLLFSADEKLLLIATTTHDRVWSLAKKEQLSLTLTRHRERSRWLLHPTKPETLFNLTDGRATELDWVANDTADNADVSHRGDDFRSADEAGSGIVINDEPRTVVWSSEIEGASCDILAISTDPLAITDGSHVNLDLEIFLPSNKLMATQFCKIPGEISARVKLLLGTSSYNLMFLGLDGWICSYDVSPHVLLANDVSAGNHAVDRGVEWSGFKRHYFLPKDWLNTFAFHMTRMTSKGTLFCPKHGDVAIVRNGLKL